MKKLTEFLSEASKEDDSVKVAISSEIYHVTKKSKNGFYFEPRYVSQLEIRVNKNTAKFQSDVLHHDLTSINNEKSTYEDAAKYFLKDVNAVLKKNGYPSNLTAKDVQVDWMGSDSALLKQKKS